MELNEYQEKAMTTCMPSSANFSYMMLNLVGEVGEFASKIAKAIRKEKMQIGMSTTSDEDDNTSDSELYFFHNGYGDVTLSEEEKHTILNELKKEAGDILWQLSGLCSVMGWSLEDVARQNLAKLASRQKRNVIDGDGDNR